MHLRLHAGVFMVQNNGQFACLCSKGASNFKELLYRQNSIIALIFFSRRKIFGLVSVKMDSIANV
jgi:hypothetical protein